MGSNYSAMQETQADVCWVAAWAVLFLCIALLQADLLHMSSRLVAVIKVTREGHSVIKPRLWFVQDHVISGTADLM